MPQTHTSDDRSQRTDDTVQTTDDSFQTTDIRQQPPDDSVYFKFFLGSWTTEKERKSSTPPGREMELEQQLLCQCERGSREQEERETVR